MARKDWRAYYAIAWDGPPPLAVVFLKRSHALQTFAYFKAYGSVRPGITPIGILRVVGKTYSVQQKLWKAAT